MPKIKTSRSAAKRFKFTKTGKVKHKRANLRHLLTSKSSGRKRRVWARRGCSIKPMARGCTR